MKHLKLLALAASVLVYCIACNQAKSKSEKTLTQDVQVEAAKKAIPANNLESAQFYSANSDSSVNDFQYRKEDKPDKNKDATPPKTAQTKVDWDKKIIKTANLNLEVKDYNLFNAQLHDIVKQFGGYVAQEEQNQTAYQIENKVSIKVPVEQFEDAMSKLTANSKKVIERKVTSEDVTGEIVDTKSRIETKKEVRLRYIDLLKQAKNMQDILTLQTEIDGIQEQLESAAGRVAYLNHSAALSTINLSFFQVTDVTGITEKEPTYLQKISAAFSNGMSWIKELVLGLVALWPLLIGGLVLFIFIKRRKPTKAINNA